MILMVLGCIWFLFGNISLNRCFLVIVWLGWFSMVCSRVSLWGVRFSGWFLKQIVLLFLLVCMLYQVVGLVLDGEGVFVVLMVCCISVCIWVLSLLRLKGLGRQLLVFVFSLMMWLFMVLCVVRMIIGVVSLVVCVLFNICRLL